MATRLLNRRWLLRDVRHLGVLSAWALTGFVILAYGFNWPALQAIAAATLRASKGTSLPVDAGKGQAIYTGSILFVPQRGEMCDQWMFDNRTGAFRDNGQVRCRGAATSNASDDGISAARMMAISKAFKGD